jgi:hypothetical protein
MIEGGQMVKHNGKSRKVRSLTLNTHGDDIPNKYLCEPLEAWNSPQYDRTMMMLFLTVQLNSFLVGGEVRSCG